MTHAQLAAQLDRDGFVRVPNVIDQVTIDTLLLRAHATLFRESAEARAPRYARPDRCVISATIPNMPTIIAYPALLDLLRGLGASDPRFTGGFLISKPAGGPPLFWHQDWWGWTEPESYAPRPQQWFAMIYLTDTTPANGCLRVIPGTHRREHPLHHLEAAHSAALQSVADPADPAYGAHPDEVAVPVRAGDVVIGDARLIHGAYANLSGSERPLLTLWYMPHWATMSAPSAGARDGGLPAPRRYPYQRRGAADPARLAAGVRNRVAAILPTPGSDAAPIAWQRVPDTARFAA